MRLLVVTVLVAGCGTYNYNRAALVPRATPRAVTGEPLAGRAQLAMGASSVAHLGDPGVGDPNAGIEIPGTQLFADFRARIGDVVSIGFLSEVGLDQGARQLKATQPPVDAGNVVGYGVALDFAIPTGDPRWHLGVGFDVMSWSVPYVEYDTCAAGSECFPYQLRQTGKDTVGTLAASLTPTYRVDDRLAVFGNLTVREHPTIDQKGQTGGAIVDDVEVDSGPANFLVGAGVELALADGGFFARAVAYYDVTRTPAEYGPGVSLSVGVPLGARRPRIPPPTAAPPPAWTPPPPSPPPGDPSWGPPPPSPSPSPADPAWGPPPPAAPTPPPLPPAPAPAPAP